MQVRFIVLLAAPIPDLPSLKFLLCLPYAANYAAYVNAARVTES